MQRLIIFISLFFIVTGAAAQQTGQKLISLDMKDTTIDFLVNKIESQTNFHFYYDPAQFDSLYITLSVKDQPLEKVLDLAFGNTDYHYAITDHYVLLTKGSEIKTQLSPDFFSGTKNDTLAKTQLPDYSDKKTLKADPSLIENKTFDIGIKTNIPVQGKVTITGYVRNVKTGEPVTGASIYVDGTAIGTSTDQFGFYSIVAPRGRQVFVIQGLGMRDTRRKVIIYSEGKFDIDMQEHIATLKEVIVTAQKQANVRNVQMGAERLNIRTIKQMPALFGEADVLRVVEMLPGVKTVGEASTGLNVRGGSADQNLVLFNDATIYNPSHFFGFFSAFNPDVVKDLELYKSSIPAKYGGRLSSILDINTREGNKKNYSGVAGIGPVTSRINIEGPLIKDKTSFLLGSRATYANWLLKLLPDNYNKSRASFYDVNLDISHQINSKNNIYFTGYLSKDAFSLNKDTTFGYGNQNLSVRWKSSFSKKVTATFIAGFDRYEYETSSKSIPVNSYKLAFDIHQVNFKSDFTWYANSKHILDYGVSTIRYLLHPGNYTPAIAGSLVVPDKVEAEKGQESAVYLDDRWSPTANLSFNIGIRYSMFNYLGPKNINEYAPGLPKNPDNLLQSRSYGNSIINTYQGPEYRLTGRLSITSDFSTKISYTTSRQYIHMLSNTTAISPTDIWKLSDPNIKPQYGDQISLGLYKNFKGNSIETSVEVYYKHIKDYLDYKSGAVLIMNHHIETDVINTKGKAYGFELLAKKPSGRLNGWISYTYSRILLKQDDSTAGEIINGGQYYPASYDEPHSFTFVGNYRLSHRFSVSLNATYNTGRPITLPIGQFYYGGSMRALYSDRNAYRIPDYFRMDWSMNIEGNHKVKQKTHQSWTMGVYNVLGRKNAYSVYYVSQNGVVNGYKLSIFGSAIPFVNFNIRF